MIGRPGGRKLSYKIQDGSLANRRNRPFEKKGEFPALANRLAVRLALKTENPGARTGATGIICGQKKSAMKLYRAAAFGAMAYVIGGAQ